MEKWKSIKEYEGLYEVSTYGRIRSIKRKITLRPTLNDSGGLMVVLSKNGKAKTYHVSRLVAIAFIPNPENKPYVDHIDGVRMYNFVSNLRWCTPKENQNFALAIENRKGSKCPIEGIGSNGKVCVEFKNYNDATRKGFNRTLIKKSIENDVPYKGIKYRLKIEK